MPNVRTPAGTRIYIQSAISATQAVTAITKAAPPVVTYAGNDPVNGNYIALTSMVGMTEFEDALLRVANVNAAANTLELEDQDSSAFGTFVSGNMQVVTMGAELLVASSLDISGFDQQYAEYSFLWDRITRKKPTSVSAGELKIPCVWDPDDPGTLLFIKSAESSAKLGFKIAFSDGFEILFFGYAGGGGLPKISGLNSVITSDLSLSMVSRPRFAKP